MPLILSVSYLVSTNQKNKVNTEEFNIESSHCEKLLVKIDSKLTFDCHASDIRKKASGEINA